MLPLINQLPGNVDAGAGQLTITDNLVARLSFDVSVESPC